MITDLIRRIFNHAGMRIPKDCLHPFIGMKTDTTFRIHTLIKNAEVPKIDDLVVVLEEDMKDRRFIGEERLYVAGYYWKDGATFVMLEDGTVYPVEDLRRCRVRSGVWFCFVETP